MIVEFIGATGAGKTTLARALVERGAAGQPVRMATDLVTDRFGRRWIENPHAVNLLADVTALPAFLESFDRHRDFLRFAVDRVRCHAPSAFAKANYLRNVVRKLGVHELARRADPRTTFLVDEGTILIAYQLFVYSRAPFTRIDLERFGRLVPLPDLVVHVKAPTDALVRRAIGRADRRRELAREDADQVRGWIARAVELFDGLSEVEPIRNRLVTVEIVDDTPERLEAAIGQVERSLERARDATPRPQGTSPSNRRSPVSLGGRTARGRATVIAFVGSEATGKSTILNEVETWLGQRHRVRRVHAGKPPSTPITFVPHVLLPALRAVFPEQRTLRVEERYEDGDRATDTPYPLLFGVRSVMLAYERRALLSRAIRSGRGTIVLSDRYPSDTSGAPDGPQLAHLSVPSGRLSLRRALARLEERLYRDIPSPDLVFHLTAPLEVTLARNAARGKREPEDYVRFRHALSSRLRFDGAPVYRIDTDRDLEVVVREVTEVIDDRRETAR
jgi:thymidylate kinase